MSSGEVFGSGVVFHSSEDHLLLEPFHLKKEHKGPLPNTCDSFSGNGNRSHETPATLLLKLCVSSSGGTYLAHIGESMSLCYPVDSLGVPSYSHRPVVGENRRATNLEKNSHPQSPQTHHRCTVNGASAN
ncbi:hypothetical protein EYF80_013250 [Liparis tanakae]|uniref:Uncharacterized protein n=1 Tax=Liparis tanakae TaxID=230148 RepID=A0A4Z2IFC4_9TELE|nr:hypothetical protein EYF80_013250 [Liparis tanakae]